MKLAGNARKSRIYSVAPHAGAWIETAQVYQDVAAAQVAPHAGAWIETAARMRPIWPLCGVAPHAGAWIETAIKAEMIAVAAGRPPCGGVD